MMIVRAALAAILGLGVLAAPLAALGAWVIFAALRRRGTPLTDRAIVLIAGAIVLSPHIFPWYVVWFVPFLTIRPSVPWIAFTGTDGLAYTFFLREPWAIPAWARAAEFLPLALGAGWALAKPWIPNRPALEACLTSQPVRGGQQ